MKLRCLYFFPFLLIEIFCLFTGNAFSGEIKISRQRLTSLLSNKLAVAKEIAENHTVIEAVQKRNQENITLDEIKRIDEKWKKSSKLTPLKKSMQDGKIGRYFESMIKFHDEIYNEMFLTDRQGANIACYPVTTDYYQGDEEKWIRAYNKGKGNVYFGEIEFDDSTQTNAIQVSIPVMDQNNAIGVLTVGVKLTHIQAQILEGKY